MNEKDNPIKVLFISHSSGMVGAERSLLLLLRHINRERFEPIVALPGCGSLKTEINRLGITTYEVKSPWWVRGRENILKRILLLGITIMSEIIALLKLRTIVKRENIDVIYTNTIVNFSGAILSVIVKIPHIWHIREIIPDNPDIISVLPNKILFKFISMTSDRIICNSYATAGQLINCTSNEKTTVIYNAVEPQDTKNLDNFPDIYGAKKTDWLIAVIGTLQERKAQDDAIKACNIARKTIPNIKLLLIGDGNEEYKNYLHEVVNRLDMTNHVLFTGYRNDVPQILPYCKVLLVPSWNEPFGRVVIEAMAAGIPVIGSNAGGVKEIIQDGVTGYLVTPKDPQKIAEKVIYLYHHPELAKSMGNEGKNVLIRRFSPQIYIHSVEKVIQQVMSR
jgi:glycosyltransferase involved in cell wall biosynthesis